MFAVNVRPVKNTHTWSEYLAAIAPGDNNARIAATTGASEATVGRWVKGLVTPAPDQVTAVARAYGQSPLVALVAAGYVQESELEMVHALPRLLLLSEFSDLELAQELVRRIEDGAAHPDLEDPADNVTGIFDRPNDGGFLDDSVDGLDTAAGKDETQADED